MRIIKKITENWEDGTNFLFTATHKNNIGTDVDEEFHSHTWGVEIVASANKLNKQEVLFNYKTISSFILGLLDNENINERLENRTKHIDKKYLPYIKDVSNEPTNEVLAKLIARLSYAKIIDKYENCDDLEVTVILRKKDGTKANEDTKNKDEKNKNMNTFVRYTVNITFEEEGNE